MARSQNLDFLQSFRFHVSTNAPKGATVPGDINTSAALQGTEAGFSAATVPEMTMEAVDYKEGQYLYIRKYPGNATFNEVTLSRGVARIDTGFWRWINTVNAGTAEFRYDVDIKHYHRTDPNQQNGIMPGAQNPPAENLLITSVNPSRTYRCYNGFPSRHKFSSDLDGTDAAVAVQELDIAYEYCALVDANGNVVT